MRNLSRFRKLTFALATLLALVFVWGLALEGAIRVFDIGPEINPVWSGNYQLSKNPLLRYELAPESMDGRTNINRHGMRDREYAVKKPPGTFRIAVIGDSIAYGLGVAEDSTFSTQLERLLEKYYQRAGDPKVEVLNFGVTGYSFAQVMEIAHRFGAEPAATAVARERRGKDFDPDIVDAYLERHDRPDLWWGRTDRVDQGRCPGHQAAVTVRGNGFDPHGQHLRCAGRLHRH